MLDDVNTTTSSGHVPIFHAPKDVTKPTLCEGFHLPNRFRIDGLGAVVEMTVDATTRNDRRVFACTSLTVFPAADSSNLETVERIPVATLTKLVNMAVKCARIVCVYYPANYHGAMLDHNLRPYSENIRIRVDGKQHVEPVKLSPPKGTPWTDDAINTLLGTSPRRRKTSITPEFLQEVADVYNSANTYRQKAVMNHFRCAKTTADNWIRKAKEQELITSTPKRATK